MPNLTKLINWKLFLLIGLLIIFAFIFLRTPKPCAELITYRIGKVDERFGITRGEFAMAANIAGPMWSKPLNRNLFREDSQGTVEINLIYDHRQEATDKLKKLNYKIDNTKSSYDDLKTRLDSLRAEYDQKNSSLSSEMNIYNSRISIFNATVEHCNRQGGINENAYKKLMQEKEELKSLQGTLQGKQENLRQLVEAINTMVVVVNEIATNINLDLVNYQTTGDVLGREFCEGYYENKKGKQTINIYQFDNDYRLVRVLAHEFGHALGLNHSDNSKAVMYRLIQSDMIELSPDDVAALRQRCFSN